MLLVGLCSQCKVEVDEVRTQASFPMQGTQSKLLVTARPLLLPFYDPLPAINGIVTHTIVCGEGVGGGGCVRACVCVYALRTVSTGKNCA